MLLSYWFQKYHPTNISTCVKSKTVTSFLYFDTNSKVIETNISTQVTYFIPHPFSFTPWFSDVKCTKCLFFMLIFEVSLIIIISICQKWGLFWSLHQKNKLCSPYFLYQPLLFYINVPHPEADHCCNIQDGALCDNS